jgi:hypothetical protein
MVSVVQDAARVGWLSVDDLQENVHSVSSLYGGMKWI